MQFSICDGSILICHAIGKLLFQIPTGKIADLHQAIKPNRYIMVNFKQPNFILRILGLHERNLIS